MLAGLKGRETALTWALKSKHKHNNDNGVRLATCNYTEDNVYNNVNFKYYNNRKNAIALA